MNNGTVSEQLLSGLRSTAAGLLLAVLTVLYGQGMGIVFGIDEAIIKGRLAADAAAVRDTAYQGDDAAIKATLDKSWAYMKRAHLHAGSIIVVLGFLGASKGTVTAISLGLGAGGLGYSIYWMWAGFRAPGLGGTSAAKESLEWLAMPSSGAYVVASVWLLVLLAMKVLPKKS
jgi:hypothetical protein